ncbi:unnamed protein product [Clavelina lepadiformis]|uniref:Uncharacterized protein n=1 Tax=Clavelina lepadiformis TaxID=159417 RepID=A0ABP0GPZ5_CLALP
MGTISHENYTFSLGFSRADASSPDTTRDVVLYGAHVPISGRTDSRVAAPYQEKRTLPGTHASVSEFVCVAALGAEAPISVSRFGNINPIPFRTTGATRASPRFRTAFAYPLGSTDPCSTAVHMEPFSTSAFKNRYGPPPEFPLASTSSGIVHHLSGPDTHALARPLRQADRIGR